jgi:peptidoglycan/LPS O-acetylase OafA/YrhL
LEKTADPDSEFLMEDQSPGTEARRSEYRPSIDGLRALAVLLVIGFHVFPQAITGGFTGVDVFFVISGFLISTILYGEFENPEKGGVRVIASFYSRRIRRIFPSLAVVLAACYVFGFKVLFPGQFAALCQSIMASVGFCLNLVASRETGYFDASAVSRPLLHIWSLGVEEQFYLVWPLVIWTAARARAPLLPVVIFLAGCSFFLAYYRMGYSPAQVFYLPQMRFWELSVGSIAAIAYPAAGKWLLLNPGRASDSHIGPSKWALWLPSGLSFLGVFLIGAGVVLIKRDFNIPGAWSLLPTFGAACIIFGGESAWFNRKVLAHPIAVWIGLISYPLYLWHWPLLVFSRLAWQNGDTTSYKLGAIGLAGVLAWCTYVFIEIPIRRGPKGFLRVLIPSAAMLAVGILAMATYRAEGIPDRFPKIIQDLDRFEFKYANGAAWRTGTYFLSSDSAGTDFKVDRNEISPDKPSLVLWGDSHAAQLYPGYNKYFSGRYNIVQRTAINTGPFLGMTRRYQPEMKGMNDFIFETIRRVHPDIVVLAADWFQYDWPRIDKTVLALKGLGIPHIIVVGPVPHWAGSLPQQLLIYFRRHPDEPLPTRLKQGEVESTGQIDALLGDLCRRLGVEYVSPYTLLADRDGFITRLGDGADKIVAWDYAHLTVAGSEFLVAQFPKYPR